MVRCVNCAIFERATRKCGHSGKTIALADIHKDLQCSFCPNNARRKWLLKAASKESNPYFQAEILYQALGDK
jgi:hypothetical protein